MLKSVEFSIPEGFDQFFRRNFLVVVSMAEDIHATLKTKKLEQLKKIKYLEDTNNRLNFILQRDLVLNGYKEARKTPFVYYLNEELERIADQMKFLCDCLDGKNVKVSKEMVDLWDKTASLIRGNYEFYFSGKENGVKLLKLRNEIVEKAINKITSKNKHDSLIAHYILVISQLSFELVESISAIVL